MRHPDDDQLVLIDADNNVIGQMDKLRAHQEGRFHRCISIQIFHPDGRWLLQRRADGKYHSPGLWSNTVCGHQRPGEDNLDAAHRRLQHEMGFDCALDFVGTFEYAAEFPDVGLSEHEFDYVYTGTWDGEPAPNPTEVGDWRWVSRADLDAELRDYPEHFTYWFQHHVVQFLDGL